MILVRMAIVELGEFVGSYLSKRVKYEIGHILYDERDGSLESFARECFNKWYKLNEDKYPNGLKAVVMTDAPSAGGYFMLILGKEGKGRVLN